MVAAAVSLATLLTCITTVLLVCVALGPLVALAACFVRERVNDQNRGNYNSRFNKGWSLRQFQRLYTGVFAAARPVMKVRHAEAYAFIRRKNPIFSWLDVPATSDPPPFECDGCSEHCSVVALLDRQLGLSPLGA